MARPAPDMIVVRHEAVSALGMAPMDLMAIVADPAILDAARVEPGDAVRLAVRSRDAGIVLLRIEKRR